MAQGGGSSIRFVQDPFEERAWAGRRAGTSCRLKRRARGICKQKLAKKGTSQKRKRIRNCAASNEEKVRDRKRKILAQRGTGKGNL